MFNRALQVKMVKADAEETPAVNQQDKTFEGKAAIVGHFLVEAVKQVGSTVLLYVAADTVRQVMVAKTKK